LPKLLIITADDYGMTEGINCGIETCVAAEGITSVCVMTNMPFWKQIQTLTISHPQVTIGIHWTVTQGRPVLPALDVQSLVDSSGEFLPPRRFRARVRRGGLVMRDLEAELEAQVLRLREVVPRVAFWNTHQNIHVYWGLYERFARIGRLLGINAMRSHRRLVARGGRPVINFYVRHPIFWLKGLLLLHWASNASRQGLALPVGRIVEPDYPPGHVNLLTALRGTDWEGAAELVTHPAASLDGLHSLTTLLESRLAEFKQFSARDFPARMAALKIDLVSFASITANINVQSSGITRAPVRSPRQ
jgi:predicted glycoside hydrolase/deacetylase ChbG (UPF0249 family)